MQKQYSWTQGGGGGDVIEVRGLFLREMLAEKGSNKKGQTPLSSRWMKMHAFIGNFSSLSLSHILFST